MEMSLCRNKPNLRLRCCEPSSNQRSIKKRESVVKRGRKPGRKANTTKTDMKLKLERSRQSARECRARKKLRYQYLEDQVTHREKAVFMLHKELEQYRQWAKEFDEGNLPEGLLKFVEEQKQMINGEENNQSE